jgi:hypothetical protein
VAALTGGDLAIAAEVIEAAADEEWRADARLAGWLLTHPANPTTNPTTEVTTMSTTTTPVLLDGNTSDTWMSHPDLLALVKANDADGIAIAKQRLKVCSLRQRAVAELKGALAGVKAGRVAMSPANRTWRDSDGGKAIARRTTRKVRAAAKG